MTVLTVSVNNLTADLAAVLISFLGKRLFSWVNVMDWRLLMRLGDSELLFDISAWWPIAQIIEIRYFNFVKAIHYGFHSLVRALFFRIFSVVQVNCDLIIQIWFWTDSQLRVLFALLLLFLEFQKSLLHHFLAELFWCLTSILLRESLWMWFFGPKRLFRLFLEDNIIQHYLDGTQQIRDVCFRSVCDIESFLFLNFFLHSSLAVCCSLFGYYLLFFLEFTNDTLEWGRLFIWVYKQLSFKNF